MKKVARIVENCSPITKLVEKKENLAQTETAHPKLRKEDVFTDTVCSVITVQLRRMGQNQFKKNDTRVHKKKNHKAEQKPLKVLTQMPPL